VPDAFRELSEKQREDHNTRDNRKLRRLKINWSQMQPAASSINFYAYELRHDEKKRYRPDTSEGPPQRIQR